MGGSKPGRKIKWNPASVEYRKGKGKGIAFLKALIGHQGDECVIWPQSRDAETGYGHLGYLGKRYYAHRMMCELANGQCPSAGHEAAHSCGRGHEGCVNPKHLSWKTRSENQLDRWEHGTASPTKEWSKSAPIVTDAMCAEIRAQAGAKTQSAIAAQFGLSRQHVGSIIRGERRQEGKKERAWTSEAAALIRARLGAGSDMHSIAAELGRSYGSTYSKALRMGLTRRASHNPQ
jgi:hypothetical protein